MRKGEKLKSNKILILISIIILTFSLIHQNAEAQQNLAQEAYTIFEQSCLICHGQEGSFKEALLIERTALINGGTVVPGNPEGSVFYQRLIETDENKRMPLQQPPLSAEAIETIRQWIEAGAPDWNAIPIRETAFITTDVILENIKNHIDSLTGRDRFFARYFTLTHLYNAGETTETLRTYRLALSKLVNSLSWGRDVVNPQPIDAAETIFYIDLRDYEWDVRNAWTKIEQVYPYRMKFDSPTQTHLLDRMTTLQQEMNSDVPSVHVDWFLATASLPPLYHEILALPDTDSELESQLEVYVAENLENAPGKRVWRAGFNDSGVSRHNRVVERHLSRYGAYWKSYDFAGSAELQNIFVHPLDFIHDGGEIIFNLPNGLQAYYLVDGVGNRLEEAPIDIVSNPAASDPTVRNGLSCIGCHSQGMKTFEDKVRAVVENAENPSYDKVQALDLYVEKMVMDELVEEDTRRFQMALAKIGMFGEIEPVQRFHEVFQRPLNAVHAASAVGLEATVFLERVDKNSILKDLLGTLVIENGTMKRDAWTSNFSEVISALNTVDSVPPPIVERVPGASVNIPDSNLRSAIAEALGKVSGDVITVEDMERLTKLTAENLDIHDITGLEYATNLTNLDIRKNTISDISPLTRLTQMHGLWLANNDISDITPLSKLTNLSVLGIYRNEILDISPLKNLTNLRGLSIYDNPISNIQSLIGMKKLIWIRMSFKEPADLSPISALINLESFAYWGSGESIPNLSPLMHLPNLINVEIKDVIESDMSSLVKLTKIKELYIINSDISDISFLNNMTSLERLNLESNNISDVSPLAGLTNLKWLKLIDNPITDFSPLIELAQATNIIAGHVEIPDRNLRAAIAEALGKGDSPIVAITFDEMKTLTTLNASGRDIEDLTGLELVTNLEELGLSDNQITELSPLADLHNLRWLNLIRNRPIVDVLPLANLRNLTWLKLSNNSIVDITPLKTLTMLENLSIRSNRISDISALVDMKYLIELDVSGNEVVDVSPLNSLHSLIMLDLSSNNIAGLSGLSSLDQLESLLLGDNEISDVSPLTSLSELRRLEIHHNKISDVTPFASLINLGQLTLHGNLISDFSPILTLPELTSVTKAYNPASPIA